LDTSHGAKFLINQKTVLLYINNETPIHLSLEECRDWISRELNAWTWMTKMERSLIQFSKEVHSSLFSRPLNALAQTLSTHEDDGELELTIGDKYTPYIESTSSDGILISNTQQQFDTIVALITLIHISQENQKAFGNNPTFLQLINHSKYQTQLGIQIAIQNSNIYEFTRKTHIDRLDTLANNFNSRSIEVQKNIEAEGRNVKKTAKDTITDLTKHSSRISNMFQRRTIAYKGYAKRAAAKAKIDFHAAGVDLTSARDAYNLKIELDTSVSYWEKKMVNHNKMKAFWLGMVILSMAIMFTTVVLYYKFGGAHANFAAYAGSTATEKNSQEPASQSTSPTPTVAGVIGLAIADLTVIALLITLISVVVRIALRQFNTHSQLGLEAEERITFTKTYLALLNEGKLRDDADRRLILEALFKPSQAITGAEIGFSTPIELILKTIVDKRTS
jgi:hypothetical protein